MKTCAMSRCKQLAESIGAMHLPSNAISLAIRVFPHLSPLIGSLVLSPQLRGWSVDRERKATCDNEPTVSPFNQPPADFPYIDTQFASRWFFLLNVVACKMNSLFGQLYIVSRLFRAEGAKIPFVSPPHLAPIWRWNRTDSDEEQTFAEKRQKQEKRLWLWFHPHRVPLFFRPPLHQ